MRSPLLAACALMLAACPKDEPSAPLAASVPPALGPRPMAAASQPDVRDLHALGLDVTVVAPPDALIAPLRYRNLRSGEDEEVIQVMTSELTLRLRGLAEGKSKLGLAEWASELGDWPIVTQRELPEGWLVYYADPKHQGFHLAAFRKDAAVLCEAGPFPDKQRLDVIAKACLTVAPR